MSGSLNRKCPYCGTDNWWAVDNKTEFIETCSKCLRSIAYNKEAFLEHFKCDICGSNNGTLQDNDDDITIICNECKNPHAVLKKNFVSIDNRHKTGIIVNSIEEAEEPVKCPKCNSTQITTGSRGFSIVTGFIGAGNTVNRCAKCGYKWTPKR